MASQSPTADAHVVHHLRELGLQLLEHGGVGLAVDLHVEVRPVAEPRVEQEVDVVPAPDDGGAHAVEDERQVAGDDLDHGVRRFPAVGGAIRIPDPNRRGAGRAGEVQVQEGGDGAGDVGGGEPGQVVGLGRIEIVVDQAVDGRGRRLGHRRTHPSGRVGPERIGHAETLGSSPARGVLRVPQARSATRAPR